MPKLWNDTITEHRHAVRDAVLDAAAALVHEHGLTGVTMSQLATAAGIGRATLYKYFPDVQAVLLAWHERQVTGHVQQLIAARDEPGEPLHRLAAVLRTYALIGHRHHGTDLAAGLHRGPHLVEAEQHLHALIRDLIADSARAGAARIDVDAAELAQFCRHALGAAADLPSEAAVERLVAVTIAALRPEPAP
ncbi:TetR/AcrR family transcriptional regulator [Dactylosporangium sp. NPDC005555]|uniref:TetR/AcrR family transcriptional regulator n=1 Tax=Dactylosporangium sp. NPDC005555 TaxID=3154889 RepID=UPI0033B045DE